MTTSYVTGTVSVAAGSDMVTGSGTGWLSANVAPGFLGLDSDNGNPVPVAEILSDTSLRLVTPWRGTSAAGQAYWLSYDTRDGQQTVNNAQRLAEYIARLNNTFFNAIGGLTPSANTFLTFDASATAVLSALTTAGRSLLNVAAAPDVIPYFTSATAVATTALTAAGRSLLGVTGATDVIPYFTSATDAATTSLTAVGRSLLGSADSAALYEILGAIPNANLPTRLQSLPTYVSDAGALDNIAETGWVSVAAANASAVNGPAGANNGVCFTIRLDGAAAVQTYYNVSANDNAWTRRRTAGAWTTWSQEAFIPARLGTTGLVLSDANLAVDTGLYIVDLSGANIPPRAARTMILHQRFAPTIMTQLAVTWTNPTQLWTRYLSGTTWSAWVLVGTTTVGAVSQSSGVPTGAVIERGNNASGEYVRFADGTQICWRSFSFDQTLAPNAYVAVNSGSITYPVNFSAVPYILLGYEGSWSPHGLVTFSGGVANGIGNVFMKNTDTSATRQFNGNMRIVAIGRWF